MRMDGDRPGLTTNGSSSSLDVTAHPFVLTGAIVGEDFREILSDALADGAAETSRLVGGGGDNEEVTARLALIDDDEG